MGTNGEGPQIINKSIRLTPIDDLKWHPSNPRRGSVEAIEESISVNGFWGTVAVQESTNRVIAGNHRWKAARKQGLTEIPVAWLDVDDETAERILLADNRTSDVATNDDRELATLLAKLNEGAGLEGSGYTDDDLTALLARVTDDEEDGSEDDIPEIQEEVISKPGEIYELGQHRLICGDCREGGDVASLLDGSRINVAITSPPYASQRKYDESSGFKPIPPDEYVDWFDAVQANVREHLAEDGSWFVNIKEHCDDGQRSLYVKDLTIAHVRRWGWRFVDEYAWTRPSPPGSWPDRFKNGFEPLFHFSTGRAKFRPESVGHPSESIPVPSSKVGANKAGPNGEYWNLSQETSQGLALPSNVIKVSGVESGTGHSAAFPPGLPAFFIKAFSDASDAIFDPFLGSGTTLIAAAKNDRRCYGMEISPAYCDIIRRRWTRWAKDHDQDLGSGSLD